MSLAVGCRARPGKAHDNKTGSWRVFKPVFGKEKCTRCGLCMTLCPEGCIHGTEDEFFAPDYTYCKGCGICAEECPGKGIEMIQEEK
jgi:pyruvate ferredoxin oxidoreductase delta subunit